MKGIASMKYDEGFAQPEAVTIDQAVKVSGIGRTVLFRLLRDGDLPSLRVGRRRLIRMQSIRDLLERLENEQSGRG